MATTGNSGEVSELMKVGRKQKGHGNAEYERGKPEGTLHRYLASQYLCVVVSWLFEELYFLLHHPAICVNLALCVEAAVQTQGQCASSRCIGEARCAIVRQCCFAPCYIFATFAYIYR
jgi:hypothetical protein